MTNILITGAGGSIGIDVARSLRVDSNLKLIGCDSSYWGRRLAGKVFDEVIALPRADQNPTAYVEALIDAIRQTQAEFAFVNPDGELEAVAKIARDLPCNSSLPPLTTIGISLDKALTVQKAGLPDLFPKTFPLEDENDLERCFTELEPPLWMRSCIGAAGRGSLRVEMREEAAFWISYWKRRGRDYRWVFQELLPGKNFNWTGIYANGELTVSAAMERLGYFLGNASASGVSGQVSHCVTTDPQPLQEPSDKVIRALDPQPQGLYSVDLREDRSGQPLVTEVNPRLAGRPWLYTKAGVNLPLAAVRLLSGQNLGDAVDSKGLRLGLHLYRQLDIEPAIGFAP